MKGPDVAVAGVAVEEECGGRHAGDVVADADGGVCVATLLDRPTGDRAAGVDPIHEAGDAECGVGGGELDTNRGRAGRPQGDPVIEGVDEHGRACAYLEVGDGDGPGLDAYAGGVGDADGVAGEGAGGEIAVVGVDVADGQNVDVGVAAVIAAGLGAEEDGTKDRGRAGVEGAGEEQGDGRSEEHTAELQSRE